MLGWMQGDKMWSVLDVHSKLRVPEDWVPYYTPYEVRH